MAAAVITAVALVAAACLWMMFNPPGGPGGPEGPRAA